MDEQPLLDKVKKSLGDIKTVSEIEKIDYSAAKAASDIYFLELKKHVKLNEKPVVIDKLPLNILDLPLINQIFPKAKFVLALRHPLDCIFSCWMQNFKLNPAMANMVDLERIVDFYLVAMEILTTSQDRYSLNIHRIAYEDLVLDFEGSVTSLLTFLNLGWETSLKNYQKTGIDRGRINTPSYSQVIRPIYHTATNRWTNYERQLGGFKNKLTPWFYKFGYSI